jgi:release factor glutamine methyltransferase
VRAIDARSLLAEATAQLTAAGVESARNDAEFLMCFCVGIERGRLMLLGEVSAKDERAFRFAVGARARRQPLQHITGYAPFRHLMLEVGYGVFIPRPETELVVDAALPRLRELDRPVVVDLCSGTGAIALAVADEVPTAQVYAVEDSPEALPFLRRNVDAEAAAVVVVDADIRKLSTLDALNGTVDVVISNPPYVPTSTSVAPEVRHDPAMAVFAGADGLALIPSVVRAASRLLKPGGLLVMEHDDTHRTTVPDRLREVGWLDVTDHDDLTGRPRFVTARRAT